jgi:hypothetical protein
MGVIQQRLILELVGLRLRERSLERRRVDLDQNVAGMNVLALGKVDLDDLAVDPRAHQHAVQGLHGADPGELDRDIGALDLAGHDRNGGRRGTRSGRRRGGPRSAAKAEIGRPTADDERQHNQPPSAHFVQMPPQKHNEYSKEARQARENRRRQVKVTDR